MKYQPLLLSLALFTASPVARADAPPDQVTGTHEESPRTIDRTWLYADDARVAAPLTVVGTTGLSYTNVTNDPSRVIDPTSAPAGCKAPCNAYGGMAANTATPGAALQLGAEVGLFPRVSLTATGQVDLGATELAPAGALGAMAGLRVQLLPPEWRHLHMVASGGYLREAWQGPTYNASADAWRPASAGGADGAWGQVAIAGDLGDLRLAGALLGEHVFANYRDGLDVMVRAGASYRVAGPFRAGVEYVGQDLEETFSSDAEGGARHLVGPVASLQLLGERLSLVSGPAVGLSSTSPTFVYRFAASYGF